MKTAFRHSMALLHSWAGVIVGSLLFTMFSMGTLSVFDREIDRWMMPGTRIAGAPAEQKLGLDGPVTEQVLRLTQGSPQWYLRFPSERVPVLELRWRGADGKTFERRFLHPRTGAVLEHTDTLGGTGFIFPFHFSLHLKWKDLGHWLAGFAGMTMLVLIVSGVAVHRKLIADFFLFRPHKPLQRASLDLHHVTGVLALPFYFAMALSGMVIMFAIYWPSAYFAAYPQAKDARQALAVEGQGVYRRAKASLPAAAPMASLDAMVAQAQSQWQGGQAYFLRVWHPGDRNSYVEIRRGHADMVTRNLDQAWFDAASGATLHRFEAAPAMTVQAFMAGVHFNQFDHWLLRWLYFLGGLAGCVMIATGFLFWLEARRARHAKKGLRGVRVVEALAVTSITGILIATLAFLIANRLLPAAAALAGYDRAALEVWAFFLTWLAAMGHAVLRQRMAWQEQAAAIAGLAPLAVALNWATTGQHLGYTMARGSWAVAGVDLMLLTAALTAAAVSLRLRRKNQPQATVASGGPLHHA